MTGLVVPYRRTGSESAALSVSRLQCASATPQSDIADALSAATYKSPLPVESDISPFADSSLTRLVPLVVSESHGRVDVKSSCRFSRCSSSSLVENIDDSADGVAPCQFPLSNLFAVDAYHPDSGHISPDYVYRFQDAASDLRLPQYAYQHDSDAHIDSGPASEFHQMTPQQFQTHSTEHPAAMLKYDYEGTPACFCESPNDRGQTHEGRYGDYPCKDDHNLLPWQRVDGLYSLTADYSFTCSHSIVYDARFSARWQHRKERQRHCHGNRVIGASSKQDSLVSGDDELQTVATPNGGARTSRRPAVTGGSSLIGSSSLQCGVCGDNAACQHYGVRTCEGCKGFFKRTVQKNSKYVCLSGRNCVIDKRRRNRCQYCRFQKCLAVGMVKEVVRRDTLKGRRGRLPSKMKPCQGRSTVTSASLHRSSQSPPVSLITALVRAFVDSTPDLPGLDYSQCYKIEMNEYPNSLSSRFRQLCYSLTERSTEVIVQWAESVPGFIELCSGDREILLRHAVVELFTLRLAYRLLPGDCALVFCDGTVLHSTQCQAGFGAEWFGSVCALSSSFHRKPGSVDLSAISVLAALSLFTLDGRPLRQPKRVEALNDAALDALRSHCSYRCAGSRPGAEHLLVARTLEKLVELRNVANQCDTTLQRLAADYCFDDDLQNPSSSSTSILLSCLKLHH